MKITVFKLRHKNKSQDHEQSIKVYKGLATGTQRPSRSVLTIGAKSQSENSAMLILPCGASGCIWCRFGQRVGRMSRYSQAEKMEIIDLVETSDLSVKQTLLELDVPRSTFYEWYRRYREDGYDGLADHQAHASNSGIKSRMWFASRWLKGHWSILRSHHTN